MPRSEALVVLGLAPGCDETTVRRAYRSLLRDTHPDLSDASDATERTIRLTVAYQVVMHQLRSADTAQRGDTAQPDDPAQPSDTAQPRDTAQPSDAAQPGSAAQPSDAAQPGSAAQPSDAAQPGSAAQPSDAAQPGETAGPLAAESSDVAVSLVDDETIGIDAPAIDVVPMLVDAAHQLGDISYLDPTAGLLEVIVEFVGAPTSSVVLSLQGRASGVTEVFCSVEPLSGGQAPAADAVTRLLLRTLRGEDPTA